MIAKGVEDIEKRIEEIEKNCERYLTAEDIKLIKHIVYGALGVIVLTVWTGIVAAGIYFVANPGGP